MKERVSRFFLTPDEKGELKFEWIKAIAIAATTGAATLLILWGTWVTKQCNVVAENRNLVISTAEVHQKEIDSNKAEIEMNNKIHHMRETKLDDKYDAKISELQKMLMQTNTLIVELLIQKNKEIEMQKQMPQQQQAPPKWPVSPTNGQ